MDKTIEEDHSMIKNTEVTLGEEIIEKCKIIEVRILEVDKELMLKTTTLEEIEVGLEKDSTQVILEEMREAVIGSDQDQKGVLIEIGLDL